MKKLSLLTAILLITVAGFAQAIKGNYAIKNVHTGLLLRIQDANSKNGTPIVGYPAQNWKCMTWRFKPTGNNTYQLQNLFSNKTLQPVTASATEGTTLEEQPLTNAANNQQYEFIASGKDAYLIKIKDADLYLTAPNGDTNAKIVLAKKNNQNTQLWTIYTQEPTM